MKINLNRIFYVKKSSTCMNKDGNPLSVYSNYSEAVESANYIGNNLIPYFCEKYKYYHLKPEKFYCKQVERKCSCVDHNGNPKKTYMTQEDAEKMANIRAVSGAKLTVYKCPAGIGFHLTSHNMI